MNVSMHMLLCLLHSGFGLDLRALPTPDQSIAKATAIRPNNPTAMMTLVTVSMPHAARE